MNVPEDWFIEKFQKLQIEEFRLSTLKELKNQLELIPNNELAQTVYSLDLPIVFDCLNDSKSEQINLACEVLSLCLGNLNIGESTNRYALSLERALLHPHSNVKLMALTEIERNVKNDDVLVDLCKRSSLLCKIINCISADETAIFTKTSNVITLVAANEMGINNILSAEVLEVINLVQNMNEINRLRIFEILVSISRESKSNFQKLLSVGLLSKNINDLYSNDILLKVNVIEILSQLALTEHGFDFLEKKGVLLLLSKMLTVDNVETSLAEPGLLRFFGNIAHWKPLFIVNNYPGVLKRMFLNLLVSDQGILGVSFDTIGYIGVTNDGKMALETLGNDVMEGLKTISKRLGSLPTELIVRALKCIENLLRTLKDNPSIAIITKKWFSNCGENPILLVWNYSKNPFIDIRLAGLGILNAIAVYLWGQEIINGTAGLVEFILDRNTEVHKDCKFAKYEIIKLLSGSSVFSEYNQNRFKNYINEGAFYIRGAMETAFEGNQ